MRTLIIAALLGACGADAGPGSFSGYRGAPAAVVLYERDFRLNSATNSTSQIPPCTAANQCFASCAIPSGTSAVCTKPDTSTLTVTQGSSPTTYTDPLGHLAYSYIDTTHQGPSVTGASIGSVFGSTGSTILVGGYFTPNPAASTVESYFDLRPTSGDNIIARGETPDAAIRYGSAAVLTAHTGLGWGVVSYVSDGTNEGVSQGLDWGGSCGTTCTHAAVLVPWTSGGTFGIGRGSTATTTPLMGGLDFLNLYSTNLDPATVAKYSHAWDALGDDTEAPVTFNRPSALGAIVNGRFEEYGYGVPVVSARGVEMNPGSQPSGNGVVNGVCLGSGTVWTGSTTLNSLTSLGSPTVTINASSGPFSIYAGDAGYKECALMADADATTGVGKKGTLNVDTTSTGLFVGSGWYAAGTSGTTTDKVDLGFATDGTPTAVYCFSLTGGATCVGSTTPDTPGGFCHFSGLTATPERLICEVDVEGSPTTTKFQFTEGNAKADTGSVTVCQYQAGIYKEGLAVSGPGPIPERIDNTTLAGDQLRIPVSEVRTWPTGDTNSTGARITMCATMGHDLPTEAGRNAGSLYLFDTFDGGTAETKIFMLQTGVQSDGHALTDVFVRDGWRSTAYATTCPGGSFGNNGTDIDSTGTLGAFPRGTHFCEKLVITKQPAISAVPRVNHYIYFDVNALGTHDATTLRASNTSGTMCAGDSTDSLAAGYAALGSRSGTATYPFNGAIDYLKVEAIP